MKYIRAGYAAAIAVVLAALALYLTTWNAAYWLPLVALVVLLWPAARHVRRSATRAVIEGDRLRYETGLLGKSTRNIQLSKVQDVRVDQSLGQRLLGVGNLSVETAGETSRLTIPNIDGPQRVADQLMDLVQPKGGA
jgi:uncharacterized membrane protein YdbT with pleckstrin-like domain